MSDDETPAIDAPDRRGMGRGMDRRTMIKAAGIAGAGAWVAPVIIDSLSSPAAAVAVAAGTYRYEYVTNVCSAVEPTGATLTRCPTAPFAATCPVTATSDNGPALTATFTTKNPTTGHCGPAGLGSQRVASASFSILAPTCTITAASAQTRLYGGGNCSSDAGGLVCVSGTASNSNPTKTVSWPDIPNVGSGGNEVAAYYALFHIQLTCT